MIFVAFSRSVEWLKARKRGEHAYRMVDRGGHFHQSMGGSNYVPLCTVAPPYARILSPRLYGLGRLIVLDTSWLPQVLPLLRGVHPCCGEVVCVYTGICVSTMIQAFSGLLRSPLLVRCADEVLGSRFRFSFSMFHTRPPTRNMGREVEHPAAQGTGRS